MVNTQSIPWNYAAFAECIHHNFHDSHGIIDLHHGSHENEFATCLLAILDYWLTCVPTPVVTLVTSSSATVASQWTCIDATMGEKERLTSPTNTSMGKKKHLTSSVSLLQAVQGLSV